MTSTWFGPNFFCLFASLALLNIAVRDIPPKAFLVQCYRFTQNHRLSNCYGFSILVAEVYLKGQCLLKCRHFRHVHNNYWPHTFRMCLKVCTNIIWHKMLTKNTRKRPCSTDMTNLVQIYIEPSLRHTRTFPLTLVAWTVTLLFQLIKEARNVLPKHFVTLKAFILIFRMSCMLFIINGLWYVSEGEGEREL